jgi:hypothetical protein
MAHPRGEHVNEFHGFLLIRPLDALTLETQLLMPARHLQGVATSS